jgi:VanZ family protein
VSASQHAVAVKNSWPQPRHLAAAALAWTILVIYGSLTPFGYQPLEWSKAAAILRWIATNPSQPAPRGDWITNVWLFVPLGFAALGALIMDRDEILRRGACVALVLLGGLLLSVGVESAQLWFPPRHPAKADVVAQTIGNAVGMGLWIVAGQALTDWSRRHLRGPRGGRVVWLLGIYAIGLLVYSLLPLDLTIRPGDLWDKYKAGKIILVPFSRWQWTAAALYGAASDTAIYLPIGILAAVWPLKDNGKGRALALRWLAGIVLVWLIELAQVFVGSRYSDVTDLILGAIGVSAGLWLATAWPRTEATFSVLQKILRVVSLVGFALLLTAVYLEPFDVVSDHEQALGRLTTMFRVPFEALRQGNLLDMISNVLRKLLLFGVLGWLAGENAMVVGNRQSAGQRPIVWGVIAGLTIAAVIEVSQAWIPPHVPDLTDVLWGAVGSGIGAYLGKFLDGKTSSGS